MMMMLGRKINYYFEGMAHRDCLFEMFFAVLSFLLILEKNWIMFIFLIVFDVAFIPLRYYFQKKDIQYKPIKQELYELFMHIDHDPNDETYNKLVIYLNKMKNDMKKEDALVKPLVKPKYRDMLF